MACLTEEYFDKLFDLNVKGTVFTVQKDLPLINDAGSIILIGSVASVKGTAAFGTYGATKAAVRNLVRTWTAELKDRRIRSNVFSPGPIRAAPGGHREDTGHHSNGTAEVKFDRESGAGTATVVRSRNDPVTPKI